MLINILIWVVILLAVILTVQAVKVMELASRVSGSSQVKITRWENSSQAFLMLTGMAILIGYVIYEIIHYQSVMLPEPASLHGKKIDSLFNTSFAVIFAAFLLTQILLLWFAWKYRSHASTKAHYSTHNKKLELAWIVLPTVVLMALIVHGTTIWAEVTGAAPKEAMKVELFARQFDWTARYAGNDKKLGRANYRLITPGNGLGVDSADGSAHDDKITRELHLPVNKPVNLLLRAQDVIHSAYLPHFRVQMNCVPGMITQFHFIPTITTEEMRKKTGNPKFDYILFCNKICGTAHYNMKMHVVVESEAQFNEWLSSQKEFFPKGAQAL
jgi:cytochrome c oxidase subunit 2